MADPLSELPSNDSSEYYAILNIPRDASDEDVRRAYRSLAQVYHPDKHTSSEQKERAQEAFGRLQEAYEVLSDPHRRQIYDVYGKEGLLAGFQLGDRLDTLDDLKKKWEEFRKKQEAERAEQLSNHRGFYQCRIDATDLRSGLRDLQPLFRSVVVQNSIDTPVGEADVVYLQGVASVRNNAGGGNVVCGYRRVLSPHDTLEGSAVLGLRSVLSLASTRQVTPYTSATVTANYTVGSGLGLHVSSIRHLPYNMQATWGWVVGPTAASGMSLNISKKGQKYIVSGKVEVGAVTALSCRVVYQLNPSINLRAIARVGNTGMDLELGVGRKWNSNTSGYMGTVVGLQGVTFKGRWIRGGQTFEVPVLLSHSYTDVKVLAAAYVLPPLIYVTVSRCVVRPLLRWQRRRREHREQQEHADAIRTSLQKAAAERALIEPVARRKARSEAAKRAGGTGLIILDAVYGRLESYLSEGGAQQAAIAAAGATETASALPTSSSDLSPLPASRADGLSAAAADADATSTAGTAASTSARVSASGSGVAGSKPDQQATPASAAAPPPWLSVTSALQYQVVDSTLTLHPGVSKKHQMGFTDPAPGSETSERNLYVTYLYGDRVYEVKVDDTDGLHLPGAGEEVAEAVRRQALLQLGRAAHGLQELI